jgi:hypothetical protein
MTITIGKGEKQPRRMPFFRPSPFFPAIAPDTLEDTETGRAPVVPELEVALLGKEQEPGCAAPPVDEKLQKPSRTHWLPEQILQPRTTTRNSFLMMVISMQCGCHEWIVGIAAIIEPGQPS